MLLGAFARPNQVLDVTVEIRVGVGYLPAGHFFPQLTLGSTRRGRHGFFIVSARPGRMDRLVGKRFICGFWRVRQPV